MAEDRVRRAAAWLYETRGARRKLVTMPEELRPADLREAYAVQRELLRLYEGGGRGVFGGAKIAITTKVMQELMKIDRPCGGTIFASMIHRSPARLKRADFGNVAVECEIAALLGADLDEGSYTRESVGGAVEACMAAIELIDDGNAEYGAFDALDLVADNAWNAGLVVGAPVAGWRRLDLAAAAGTMTVGSRFEGQGKGADVMGHPFEALAWLANTYAGQGRPLRRGMIVTTGSVVSTQWPKEGEEVVVRIDGLGEARARFD